jgi:NDP-sugar pyrophosphorylase family protein
VKRAVILAGGRGTRLRPYTVSLPKPLMPVVDTPILEIIVRQLVRAGFDHVSLAVNHQADIFRAYFGDGSKWRTRIDYSLETVPLSTMGPLRLIPDLPDDFLVMNGDVLTDLDFAAFLAEHERERRLFTISATARRERIDYGVLEVGADGLLSGFREKPVIPYLVSMGVYAVSRRVLEAIPPDRAYGFDDLLYDLLARRAPVAVREHAGYWLDIGRPDDYEKAVDDWPRVRRDMGL